MNYVLLNADGSLNEQNFEYYVMQGNSGDQFFVGLADALNTDISIAVCTLPNETQNSIAGVWKSAYEYATGETADGWLFTLTTAQTNYNGLLRISISIIRSSSIICSYPIAIVVNETGVRNDTDTGVTIEEINSYLLQLQTELGKKVDKTSSAYILYGTGAGGVQKTIGYGVSGSTGTIVQRDVNGNLRVPLNPSGDEMATSKKYVDDNLASKANDDEVVHIAGTETITGQKTFTAPLIVNGYTGNNGVVNLYYTYVSTNSKTYFARVGVTSNQYVYYDLPKNYSDLGSEQHLTIATEDYVTTQIASAVANVYKVQGTEMVGTLNMMPKSSSMNGYVYNMYNSGTLNNYSGTLDVVEGDNVLFVWNNGNWYWDKLASNIDLSGLVPKTTTICGIALSSSILSSELTDALILASNTDIDNLF